jgi:hypothetical protein
MKTKNILFAAGLLTTTFQASAQLTTVIGASKNPLKLEIDKKSPVCHGDQNGKISISIGGGKGPYTVNNQIIDGNIFQIGSLSAGTYTFNIADDSTSFVTAQVNLVDVLDLQVSSVVNNASTYQGSNGSINLIVNEIDPTYFWEDMNPNSTNTLVIANEDQTGLSAGFYAVTITNANGCSTSRKFEIKEPNAPVIAVLDNPSIIGEVGPTVSSNISVYPNPSSGHVTINADATVRSVAIMNDLGIVLKQLDFTNEAKLTGLDLNPGVYTLISIDENGNRATERIIIR